MKVNLISVIIPVYNTAEYLPRCLNSILNNTYRDLEVICVNDGSPDNSLEVLNSYAEKDSRVKVIDQENSGVSAARNHGLDVATGEYIAFVDSDDWVHSRYFEILLNGLRLHHADVAVCREREVSAYVEDSVLTSEVCVFRALTQRQIIHDHSAKRRVWGRIYRRDLIADLRFQREIRLEEDVVFNLGVIFSNNPTKLVIAEVPMYFYYMRADSAVHTLIGDQLEPVARWYLEQLPLVSEEIGAFYAVEAIKALCFRRYCSRLLRNTGDLETIRFLLRQVMVKLLRNNCVSMREKVLYTVLSAVPLSYRAFRIIKDPTMLVWEKNMRAQRKSTRSDT